MAKSQRFQRMPESREASIWDTFQGEYPALTSWAAPTYQHWYPYPFGDPYAKEPGLSPMEKLLDPNAQAAPASPEVPSFAPARGGLALGGSEMGQPPVDPGVAALGLLGGGLAGAGIEAGLEKVGIGGGAAGASPVVTGGATAPSVGTALASGVGTTPFIDPTILAQSQGDLAGTSGGSLAPSGGVPSIPFPVPPEVLSGASGGSVGSTPSGAPVVGAGGQGGGGVSVFPQLEDEITGITPLVQGPNAEALAREAAAGANESLMGANPWASLTAKFPFANLSPEILEAAGLPPGTSVVDFLSAAAPEAIENFLSSASPELIEASGLGGLMAEGISGGGLSGLGAITTPLSLALSAAFMPDDEQGLATGVFGPNTRGSSPIQGPLRGALMGLPFGPVGMAAGGIAGLIHSLTGGQASLAQRQAKEKSVQQHGAVGTVSGAQVNRAVTDVPELIKFIAGPERLQYQGFVPPSGAVRDQYVKDLGAIYDNLYSGLDQSGQSIEDAFKQYAITAESPNKPGATNYSYDPIGQFWGAIGEAANMPRTTANAFLEQANANPELPPALAIVPFLPAPGHYRATFDEAVKRMRAGDHTPLVPQAGDKPVKFFGSQAPYSADARGELFYGIDTYLPPPGSTTINNPWWETAGAPPPPTYPWWDPRGSGPAEYDKSRTEMGL